VRTLVVWCPDWPVTAAGFAPDDPVAVLHANRVVACSAAARRSGVQRGIRRREAQGRCPEAVVLDHDPSRDARAFEPIVAALDALCPRIEILRPGRMALAARGPSRYFGGEEAFVERVHHTLDPLVEGGVRIGIADGPFAAMLAARTGKIVEAGQSRMFLSAFPVTALERPELADLLQRLGLHRLGDLAGLPPAQVLARFGPDGALAHRLARGLDERPLQARVPPPDFSVSETLDPPADRVDRAAFVAKSLADTLQDELASRGLACTRILIEAETENGEELARLWRHDGALTAGAIAERVRWQLDGWLNAATWGDRPTSGITLVRLTPDEVRPDTGRQLGFWGGSTLLDERAARALARVQGLLGPAAVGTAVLQGGRSPAERVRFVPWGDAREADRPELEADLSPWPGAVPAPAPALVHDPPLEATVVDAAGSSVAVTGRGLCSSPPTRLSVLGGLNDRMGRSARPERGRAGGDEAITRWAGPWPVEERWWDPPAHRRRARFQLQTSSGAAYLAAVEGGRWWIEATYD
jgi:protein ImuB